MIKNSPILIIVCLMLVHFSNAQNAPIANDDGFSTILNTTLFQDAPGLLNNDSDPDGNSISIESFVINGIVYNSGESVNFTEGSILISADGSFIFTPNSGFTGNISIINYTITDGTSTNSANLNISVFLPPEPPVARDDYDTVDINTTLNVANPGVLVNDTDSNFQDNLEVINFTVNGVTFLAGTTANLVQGNVTIEADGSYTFEPTPNYTGEVPNILYTISDGIFSSSANLLLTVEPTEDLLEINSLGSCNQGFNANGEYIVVYSFVLTNRNNSRELHEPGLIRNIDLVNNLQDVFGNGCIVDVENVDVRNDAVENFSEGTFFPREFDTSVVNPNFLDASSNSLFIPAAIPDLTLYPRQSIFISYCVAIDADCNGRPNPTPSGSGLNFTNTIDVTSDKGNDTDSLTLTDFHTTEAVVSAGLYVPEFNNVSIDPPGVVNFDGTYDYTNTVIITNEGSVDAQNINFNMGLDDFRNRVVFNNIVVQQISGPAVNVNNNYNGNDESYLLEPNNVLPSGETITIQIFYEIGPVNDSSYSNFTQLPLSQTQGVADDFDESTAANQSTYSYVSWSDGLGNHLDRYYYANAASADISSELYCSCTTAGMRFIYEASSQTEKTITEINTVPNGILEHEEITFQITIENTSESIQLDELQLTDNLTNACGGVILSVSEPVIVNSTASLNPSLNPSFNGVSDTNIFDGNSGILIANEIVTVEFTVLFNESCTGVNVANFSGRDPLDNVVTSSGSENVSAFTDSDNDGISNDIDIDDDNDTIPDLLEYGGLDPLEDDDSDFIPNYRDSDFGIDSNGDGIVDVFDFDNDGVPNHFDLDSDNDGVLDIVEAGNEEDDGNRNGMTNNSVGLNGLDNTKENNDSVNTSISYTLINTDSNGNSNFLDIDSDDDGIVDNIEAQPTNNYVTINNLVSEEGINTAYPNGISPVDTESDGIPDYIDVNSDNDIRDDIIEGYDANSDGVAELVPLLSDSDNDGLDDAFDNDDSTVNPTNGQTPQSFPNFDNVDNPERDWREIIAVVVLIDDITITEGEELNFSIRLVTKNDNTILIESTSPITIDFSTSDGTSTADIYDVATSPFDYMGFSSSIFTIDALDNNVAFSVNSFEDDIYELTEFFTLNGIVTSNNTANNSIIGIGTILDNDDPPAISMNDSRADEGMDLLHTIVLAHPCSTPITIDINSSDIIAVNPDDYTSISEVFTIEGTINPDNANLEVSFNIGTLLDNLNELDEETLNVIGTVNTGNVGNQDLTKTGTIVDIDPNPFVDIQDVTVVEGNIMRFTIQLLNADMQPMRNYLDIDLNLETISQSATVNDDFQYISELTTIPALTSLISQSVNTIDDQLNEDTEIMLLQATMNFNLVSNSFPASGTGFIKDNDYPNLFSPNGDGRSDVFKISGIEDYPNFKLIIFNRQGNEVYNYSNNGLTNPLWWDGTHNGKPVSTGVYYYTLDFNDPEMEPITNFIQLIR